MAAPLHLLSLIIHGFRGIDELAIPRLGRVTLLAGKNGVGKTTVLDAVQVYASRGRYSALDELLRSREEVLAYVDYDGEALLEPDWAALFHGRDPGADVHIGIGSHDEQLSVSPTLLSGDEASQFPGLIPQFMAGREVRVLKVEFGGQSHVLPCFLDGDVTGVGQIGWFPGRRAPFEPESSTEVVCRSLGPGVPGNEAMARFWDAVALTDDEEQAVRAVGLVLGDAVERAAVIGGQSRAPVPARLRDTRRRFVSKLSGSERPVPLRSLGDGALRLLGVALALANSRDGFLLMDEAGNGMHHSVQTDFWRMVLASAEAYNVQVLATTHSWDCVRGFAQAAAENEDAEGLLYRIERLPSGLRAVDYTEEDLVIAAEHGIEVR